MRDGGRAFRVRGHPPDKLDETDSEPRHIAFSELEKWAVEECGADGLATRSGLQIPQSGQRAGRMPVDEDEPVAFGFDQSERLGDFWKVLVEALRKIRVFVAGGQGTPVLAEIQREKVATGPCRPDGSPLVVIRQVRLEEVIHITVQ